MAMPMVASSGALSIASSVAASIVLRGGARAAPPPPPPLSPLLARTWYAVPQPIRFFASGNLGNLCFFYCELAVSGYLAAKASLPESIVKYKDSISFFLGYLIHIIAQHFLHATLVYGVESINTPARYFKTLGGMYATLITSAIGSTFLNGVLLKLGVQKTIAFVGTLWLFACINYVVLGWIIKISNAGKESDKQVVVTRERALVVVRKKPTVGTLCLVAGINYVVLGWLIERSNGKEADKARGEKKKASVVRKVQKKTTRSGPPVKRRRTESSSSGVRGGAFGRSLLGLHAEDTSLPLGRKRGNVASVVQKDWILRLAGRPVEVQEAEILMVSSIADVC